jgi:hypothetical protein
MAELQKELDEALESWTKKRLKESASSYYTPHDESTRVRSSK